MSQEKFTLNDQKQYTDLRSENHQYGISAVLAQTSLHRATSDGIMKCQLFCQDTSLHEGTLVMWAHVVYKQSPTVVIPVN